MKNFFALAVSLFFAASAANAQYFYKDIVNNAELTKSITLYKENKVRKVSVTSIEPDGTPSEGFFCEKTINKKCTQISFFSRSNFTPASLFVSDFSEDGYLIHSSDSSQLSVTNTNYEYDAQKRVSKITSVMKSLDDDFMTEQKEEHIYQYTHKGVPERMFLVNNSKDTVLILFAANDDGLIETEMNTQDGSYYYYYYDSNKRLTDITLSSDLRPKPVPQYIFQYNQQGNISQMTTVEEGNKDFTVWKYKYENGMVVSEKCYGKRGAEIMGSLEYEYK